MTTRSLWELWSRGSVQFAGEEAFSAAKAHDDAYAPLRNDNEPNRAESAKATKTTRRNVFYWAFDHECGVSATTTEGDDYSASIRLYPGLLGLGLIVRTPATNTSAEYSLTLTLLFVEICLAKNEVPF